MDGIKESANEGKVKIFNSSILKDIIDSIRNIKKNKRKGSAGEDEILEYVRENQNMSHKDILDILLHMEQNGMVNSNRIYKIDNDCIKNVENFISLTENVEIKNENTNFARSPIIHNQQTTPTIQSTTIFGEPRTKRKQLKYRDEESITELIHSRINEETKNFKKEFDEFKRHVFVKLTELSQNKISLKETVNDQLNLSLSESVSQKPETSAQSEHPWITISSNNKIKQKNITQRQALNMSNRFSKIRIDEPNPSCTDSSIENNNSANAEPTNNIPGNGNQRRPNPVINYYPERDIANYPKNNRIRPGNTKYNESAKYGKKTFIYGTSMIKGIRQREFNSYLKKCSARFRPFPGATLKQMSLYVVPTLHDDTPDVAVIHAGCNDVRNHKLTCNDIATGIINIAEICRSYSVNDVLVSSLICRSSSNLNIRIKAINAILKRLCYEKSLRFIDNGNIEECHLAEDGLHLNDNGKCVLANNYIRSLNSLL